MSNYLKKTRKTRTINRNNEFYHPHLDVNGQPGPQAVSVFDVIRTDVPPNVVIGVRCEWPRGAVAWTVKPLHGNRSEVIGHVKRINDIKPMVEALDVNSILVGLRRDEG